MGPRPFFGASPGGARLCDKAIAIERALFSLELRMADADNAAVSCPLADERIEPGLIARFRPRPGLFALREALAARACVEPPDKNRWPRRGRMPPLSAAEHFVLGDDLSKTRATLMTLSVTLANTRPRSIAQRDSATRANQALRKLDTLRSTLDDIVCRDHPDGYRKMTPMRAYYPAHADSPPPTE